MSHYPPFQQVEAGRPDFDTNLSLRFTKAPQPDWRVGQGLNNAKFENSELFHRNGPVKTLIPYEDISPPEMYKLMINSIVPRPIALCSSLSVDGKPNLAPYSYFSAVGSDPPCIMMSITLNGGSREKDTASNIRDTKEFVIAMVSETFIEAANYAAVDAPKEVSEWKLTGLTPEASITVKPARVKEAAVNMECELEHLHEMFDPTNPKKSTQVIIIGRIKSWHIRKDFLVEGRSPMVALEKLMPVGRLGDYSSDGIGYSRVLEPFELPKPTWSEEKGKDEVKKVLSPSQEK